MSNEKSPERLAVERTIQQSREPITASDITAKTGLHEDTVRSHLNNCINNGLVRNTCPGQKPATYVWGLGSRPIGNIPEPRTCLTMGQYTPPKGAPMRAGANDAYTIPSLVSGQSVERRRPILMASSASTNLNARPL